MEKREKLVQTEFLGHISDYMFDMADILREALFKNRLFEVLQILVSKGPMNFFTTLQAQSWEQSQSQDMKYFYGIIIRINEID